MIRLSGRKTPAVRYGRFAFWVAPPCRPIAPPQLRSVARVTGTLSSPLLGTSTPFHPVGRAHVFDFVVQPTKPDTWNVAGLWVILGVSRMPFFVLQISPHFHRLTVSSKRKYRKKEQLRQ
ncbi:MAG: hypothetical protein IPN19_12620 [Elusimicrobia bacterium]|nr:hypothetical protein [Elusimicrobiota bacterium]